jgi:hypothetical protein
MNKLIETMTNVTTTENGAVTFKSSMDKNVDLFFSGAVTSDTSIIRGMILNAFREDKLLALKISFYLRDVREGQGKRDVIRALILVLAREDSVLLAKLLPFIPMIGRWKDVFEQMPIYTDEQKDIIKVMISVASKDPTIVGMMAKWMPRKGVNAVILTKLLELTPKEYRRFIVDNSNTVEQLMCAREWDSINFEHVPSVASKIYQKAFMRNTEQYSKYVDSLIKGEAKVNASVLFPHDIIVALQNGNKDVLNEQWNSLPNYMEGSEKFNVLPVIDTSGSMNINAYGIVTCMQVAIGLGVYLSQRNEGAYKNFWCNFNLSPTFYTLKEGNIDEVVKGLNYNNWGTSTNINLVFTKLLNDSVKFNVPAEDMPRIVLIISDMEFNSCGTFTNYEKFKSQYEEAGYKAPLVVFWNVSSSNGTSPVRFNEENVAMIGGYSPVIMKQILQGGLEDMTPLGMMLKTIKDKYEYLNDIL